MGIGPRSSKESPLHYRADLSDIGERGSAGGGEAAAVDAAPDVFSPAHVEGMLNHRLGTLWVDPKRLKFSKSAKPSARSYLNAAHVTVVHVILGPNGELLGFSTHPSPPAVRDVEVQRLVDATESKAGKADAIQVRMRAKAVELVMNGTSWLTATELFAELPKKPSNAHTVLARWLEQGRIFAMEKSGVRIYPRYAFDAMVEPVPLLKEVLKVLAGRSPFQTASWFESPSNYLDGKRPREVLETNGLAVVTAAQRLVEGAVHG